MTRADEIKHLPTGQERILYVDDEEPLVDLGKKIMEFLGYDVVTKTNSLEALELFREQSDNFDLVITDMTMPNLTGMELSQELMHIRPEIPIILCSGFSAGISAAKIKKSGIREFVAKPLLIKELANTVRDVLDEQV